MLSVGVVEEDVLLVVVEWDVVLVLEKYDVVLSVGEYGSADDVLVPDDV